MRRSIFAAGLAGLFGAGLWATQPGESGGIEALPSLSGAVAPPVVVDASGRVAQVPVQDQASATLQPRVVASDAAIVTGPESARAAAGPVAGAGQGLVIAGLEEKVSSLGGQGTSETTVKQPPVKSIAGGERTPLAPSTVTAPVLSAPLAPRPADTINAVNPVEPGAVVRFARQGKGDPMQAPKNQDVPGAFAVVKPVVPVAPAIAPPAPAAAKDSAADVAPVAAVGPSRVRQASLPVVQPARLSAKALKVASRAG
jgi:hypothetical protein